MIPSAYGCRNKLRDILHNATVLDMKSKLVRNSDVKTSFYLPRALLRAAKLRAAQERVSLRVVLVRAVAAYLAQPLKKEDDA